MYVWRTRSLEIVQYEFGRMVDDHVARERLVLVRFLHATAEQRVAQASEHFQIDLLNDERLQGGYVEFGYA